VKIHQLTVEEAFASLHSGPEGLTTLEAARRLAEFGSNRVERVAGPSLWSRFVRGFTHLFAVILWVAAALAFVAEWRDPGQGMATLGFAIVGVFLSTVCSRSGRSTAPRGRSQRSKACCHTT
jgi:magnesium-transporting ATPase (P-type)